MITLQEITKHNWLAVVFLKVRKDQANFIASNAFSLAQLHFLDNFQAKAIYAEDTPVGFAMYGIDDDDGEYWIYRFMIDEKFQGKHYGRQAMEAIIEDIRLKKETHHQTITLSSEPDNHRAFKFYENFGFHKIDGLVVEGEQVARFTF